MTDREYRAELRKIELRGQEALRRKELKAARGKYKQQRKKPAVAKLALWYIFGSCTIVQIYSMVAMWHFADLSPLITLIGATVGETISYCAYAAKSTKENTSGGIVYDLAMQQQQMDTEADPENSEGAQEGPKG